MAKATPRSYVEPHKNAKGEPRLRVKVRVKDNNRATGYYE
jgi:hypothetical protein